jgi:hypothetical protein
MAYWDSDRAGIMGGRGKMWLTLVDMVEVEGTVVKLNFSCTFKKVGFDSPLA